MENHKNSPHNRQGENNRKTTQFTTIFYFLLNHEATASMVADATGIPQKCITRYKRDMEKAGLLWELEKKPCELTGFKAWYLTTDPTKTPDSNRLNFSQR